MTNTPHTDHFGNPLEIGKEYVYVYSTRTSVGFTRVIVSGFTPKMVQLSRFDKTYGHCYGDKLFPVPA